MDPTSPGCTLWPYEHSKQYSIHYIMNVKSITHESSLIIPNLGVTESCTGSIYDNYSEPDCLYGGFTVIHWSKAPCDKQDPSTLKYCDTLDSSTLRYTAIKPPVIYWIEATCNILWSSTACDIWESSTLWYTLEQRTLSFTGLKHPVTYWSTALWSYLSQSVARENWQNSLEINGSVTLI